MSGWSAVHTCSMALDNAYPSQNERIRENIICNSPPLSHALCAVVNPPSRTNFSFRPTARIGPKVFNEFTVPVCRVHHRQLHHSGRSGLYAILPFPPGKSFRSSYNSEMRHNGRGSPPFRADLESASPSGASATSLCRLWRRQRPQEIAEIVGQGMKLGAAPRWLRTSGTTALHLIAPSIVRKCRACCRRQQ
jgi:hypothetical protein